MQSMIKSFKCKYTESLSSGNNVRTFADIAKVARRKPRQLEIAGRLDDLKIPLGNYLEALNGYWLRAQAAHDTEVAERTLGPSLNKIKPYTEFVAQQ